MLWSPSPSWLLSRGAQVTLLCNIACANVDDLHRPCNVRFRHVEQPDTAQSNTIYGVPRPIYPRGCCTRQRFVASPGLRALIFVSACGRVPVWQVSSRTLHILLLPVGRGGRVQYKNAHGTSGPQPLVLALVLGRSTRPGSTRRGVCCHGSRTLLSSLHPNSEAPKGTLGTCYLARALSGSVDHIGTGHPNARDRRQPPAFAHTAVIRRPDEQCRG